MTNKTEQLDLDRLEALARAATPGPWSWWTSNSVLRLTGEDGIDGGVLHAYAHRGHADICCGESDRAFIAAANPAAVLALIALARRPPVPAARPTDDELWDSTLRDRDNNQEWADKLADAIAIHFGVDIGEHSNANCPWHEALEAIESAPPVAQPEGEAPQAVYQMRNRAKGGPWQETDADRATCLKRMPQWADVYEFRTLYTAPAAQQAESGARLAGYLYGDSFTPAKDADSFMIGEGTALYDLAAQSQGAQAAVLEEQASVALIQRKKIQALQKENAELRADLAAKAEAPADGWIGIALVKGEETSVAFRDEGTARAICVSEPFPFWKSARAAQLDGGQGEGEKA